MRSFTQYSDLMKIKSIKYVIKAKCRYAVCVMAQIKELATI